jgi:hypothetical protein
LACLLSILDLIPTRFRRSWGLLFHDRLCRSRISCIAPLGGRNVDTCRTRELNDRLNFARAAAIPNPTEGIEENIMRPALTKVVAASLAALLVGATAATSEAAVFHGGGGRFHGGFGGWHGGGFHRGWRGGGWGGWGGGWGPGIVGGLAAGAILGGALAAPYAYGYGYGGCYQYQPMYSPNGVYLGSQPVNVCGY